MLKSSKFYLSLLIWLICFSNLAILCELYLENQNKDQKAIEQNSILKNSAIYGSLNLTNGDQINGSTFYAGITIPINGKVFNKITLIPYSNINVSIFANEKLYPEFKDTTDSNGDFKINFTIPTTIKNNTQIEIWVHVTDSLPGDIEYLNHYEIIVLNDNWLLSPFTIDDSGGGDYTWTQAVLQPWCSGGGTMGNPYVIENINMDVGGSGSGIIIRNSNTYFKIMNSIIINGGGGMGDSAIRFENVNNGMILNNTISNNKGGSIYLNVGSEYNVIQTNELSSNIFGIHIGGSSNNNKILDNSITDTINRGILVDDCYNCVVDGNTVINSSNGILVTMDSHNANITNNLLVNNPNKKTGLYIRGTDTYVSNNTMIGNGLELYGSRSEIASITIDTLNNVNGKPVYYYKNKSELGTDDFTNAGQVILYNCNNSVISNLQFSNGHSGVTLFYSNNNKITKNNFSTNFYGINMYVSNFNNISENIIKDNIGWQDMGSVGIYIILSKNNIIQRNIIKNNTAEMIFFFEQGGIYLYQCDNSSIESNEITYNSWGIFSLSGSYNNIKKNNISYNIRDGINLYGYNYTISSNYISNNQRNGVRLIGYNNTILENTIKNNDYGIKLENECLFNEISRNIIKTNNFGIEFDLECSNNSVYFNFFHKNGKHAIDNGYNNKWNSTTIGNYWDNHSGPDVNPPYGIIDIPYIYIGGTAGSVDYLPILAYSPPIITINSPNEDEIFGTITPSYNFSIFDDDLLEMWYTLDGGLHNYTFTAFMGAINPTVWAALSDGIIILAVYASNIQGKIGSAEVTIIKDTQAPVITINSPGDDDLFGSSAPSFNVRIIDYSLNTSWYTLDSGSNIYTFSDNGTINPTVWAALSDGPVTITFYANDTFGYLGSAEVTIIKDTQAPIITINSPGDDDLFDNSAPSFNVRIIDNSLDTSWYTLDGGLSIYPFSDNGTINPTIWAALSDGPVTIKFYANDTLGNLGSAEVTIIKDTQAPVITINSPGDDDLFGSPAPSFNVRIIDYSLNTSWYSLDGGLSNYPFSNNGTINPTVWAALSDGPVMITFYANDTFGYLGSAEVTIIKDTQAPVITVNSPRDDDLFDNSPPSFNVRINDYSLDTSWYTLDGGLNNYPFSDNGTINPTVWVALSDGPVKITFYANDKLGNLGSEEVTIIKDTQAPVITINSPGDDDLFDNSPPSFNVRIIDYSLNTSWYSLDGGLSNYTFSNNGTINPTVWEAFLDGPVTITFYANDTFGCLGSTEVTLIKDTQAPEVFILVPSTNDVFEFTPIYEITVIEKNLDCIWYTLEGGNKYFITELIGAIDQDLWNSLPNGYIRISFYANDTLGKLSYDEIIIIKNVPSGGTDPVIVPVLIVVSVIGGIALITIVYIFMKRRVIPE